MRDLARAVLPWWKALDVNDVKDDTRCMMRLGSIEDALVSSAEAVATCDCVARVIAEEIAELVRRARKRDLRAHSKKLLGIPQRMGNPA
jgi:hypothetical protein